MGPNAKPIILLLEDDDQCAKVAQLAFGDKVTVVRARNVEEAIKAYLEPGVDFDGMYIDGVIKGKSILTDARTNDFVDYVRALHYGGPMVTASSSLSHNKSLIESGCTIFAFKEDAPSKLLEALGLD